jgi:hypothetical protein
MKVICPQEAVLAIVKGAVMFGNNPRLIQERITPRTYGICVNEPFDSTQHPTHLKSIVEGQENWENPPTIKIVPILFSRNCLEENNIFKWFIISSTDFVKHSLKKSFLNRTLSLVAITECEYVVCFIYSVRKE